jgi:hypothetical protein
MQRLEVISVRQLAAGSENTQAPIGMTRCYAYPPHVLKHIANIPCRNAFVCVLP